MAWDEFCGLISGLMADTPLGQIISIRAEKDAATIKRFSPDQRRIHKEWMSRTAIKALDNPEKLDRDMENLSKMLEKMFGGG